jgi:hypothetical protein
MTKKDYILIAAALRGDAAHLTHQAGIPYERMTPWYRGAYDQWNTAAMAVADALASDNPKFDRSRFLAACGVMS